MEDIEIMIKEIENAPSTKKVFERLNKAFEQKEKVLSQIEELKRALNLINYKCWYYQEALKDGNEKRVKQLTPEQMPSVIQEAYQQTHHLFVDKG